MAETIFLAASVFAAFRLGAEVLLLKGPAAAKSGDERRVDGAPHGDGGAEFAGLATLERIDGNGRAEV